MARAGRRKPSLNSSCPKLRAGKLGKRQDYWRLGPDTYVDLMDQYYPAGKVSGTAYVEISRLIAALTTALLASTWPSGSSPRLAGGSLAGTVLRLS